MKMHPAGFLLVLLCGVLAGPTAPAAEKEPVGNRPLTSQPATNPAVSPVTFVVTDHRTGKPVPEFSYNCWIETEAGNFTEWEDRWVPVHSPAGTFRIDAPASCSVNLGVRARDYTDGRSYPSYRSFLVKADDRERRFELRLTPGMLVRGTVRDADTGKPIAGATVSPLIFTPPGFSPDRERNVVTPGASWV